MAFKYVLTDTEVNILECHLNDDDKVHIDLYEDEDRSSFGGVIALDRSHVLQLVKALN